MTRATLGERATAIQRKSGGRAASLERLLAGSPRNAALFEDLMKAPDWLGWENARRQRLGRAAALAAIAPKLAASVDGRWLGALAKTAGDDLLDWARTLPAPHAAIPAFAADEIDAVGASALRDAVPVSLRDHAAPHAPDAGVPEAALTAALVQCSI
ncbi:hypothetical protein [Glacieibacterium frigidum]|uniref:Uncharacterized protein n=1 Tax=Glacieibacterium frigidum TaxID=2593303 RepID=A0A552UGL3_9SPHN|nr:hypothetical protein [Glacieibacterium frigidum]TRW17372.1 hypothetical protein FMM06_04145 [Glacieibacterium frigidum]